MYNKIADAVKTSEHWYYFC